MSDAADLLKPYRVRHYDFAALSAAKGRCQHCGREKPLEVYEGVPHKALCFVCAARHFGALVMQEVHLNAIVGKF